MLTATLVRDYSSPKGGGTKGMLLLPEKGLVLPSLELDWNDNKRRISCIPLGTYEATMVYSPAFKKKTYLLKNVENRDCIRIHSVNFASQLLGCIALGLTRITHQGKPMLVSSRIAIKRLEAALEYKPFKLQIVAGS